MRPAKHLFSLIIASLLTTPVIGQQSPDQVTDQRIEGVRRMLDSSKQIDLDRFILEHLAKSFVDAKPMADLENFLQQARKNCGNAGGLMIQPSAAGIAMKFETARGHWELDIDLQEERPRRITDMRMRRGTEPEPVSYTHLTLPTSDLV